VLDIPLSGMDGLTLQALLRERQIDVPIIFVTGIGDISIATRAMRMGAYDFLEKPPDAATLRRRVGAAVEKDIEQRERAAWLSEISGRIDKLSDRERAILDQILEGDITERIAEKVNIAPRTVEEHRRHIMAKMQVSSVAELVRLIVTYESGGFGRERARALDLQRQRDQR
jgi:two-component system response regulator FixJ